MTQKLLLPRDESELAEIVRAAPNEGDTFEIVGAATKRGLGRPVDCSAILDLRMFSGIVSYEPDEFVITARAATPLAEIESAIAGKDQRLGFEPADWACFYGTTPEAATIGGILSADASGAARVRFGAARDHLLGYRGVNGLGEIYRAGGHVVKNVTGFDLPKLVCGAMGTLGTLTEVTLRLVPRARDRVVLAVRDLDAEHGLRFLRRVWSSPLDASGLSYIPGAVSDAFPELSDMGRSAALIRLEGGALTEKTAAVRAFLNVEELVPMGNVDRLFSRIGDGTAFARRPGNVWRVFVPPEAAASFARASRSPFWLADWSGGVVWLEGETGADYHALAADFGGHARLMRADADTRRKVPVFSLQGAGRRTLELQVKNAFDPHRLFNPGRMFDGV